MWSTPSDIWYIWKSPDRNIINFYLHNLGWKLIKLCFRFHFNQVVTQRFKATKLWNSIVTWNTQTIEFWNSYMDFDVTTFMKNSILSSSKSHNISNDVSLKVSRLMQHTSSAFMHTNVNIEILSLQWFFAPPFQINFVVIITTSQCIHTKWNDVERIIISFGINMLHMWSNVNEKFLLTLSYFRASPLRLLQHETKREKKIS